jgi:hypothetical protein
MVYCGLDSKRNPCQIHLVTCNIGNDIICGVYRHGDIVNAETAHHELVDE